VNNFFNGDPFRGLRYRTSPKPNQQWWIQKPGFLPKDWIIAFNPSKKSGFFDIDGHFCHKVYSIAPQSNPAQ